MTHNGELCFLATVNTVLWHTPYWSKGQPFPQSCANLCVCTEWHFQPGWHCMAASNPIFSKWPGCFRVSQRALGTSAEHQWGSEGDRTVSFIRQPHTHIHKWRAQGSEGHNAPLGMCIFLPYVLMPLARFKWKDKPCCNNQLPLLLSCWNGGKDITWTRIWTGCTARSNYNARLHMNKTDVPKMLKKRS